MTSETELAITSDASGQLWNISVWDLNSGTMYATYKGGVSKARTLSLIGDDYIVSAEPEKPLLHVWSLQKRERKQIQFATPGRVSALAVSLDGFYCVAGIDEKIHVWQVASGNLMAIISSHYQTISCVKFTMDGSHFVSSGNDGITQVWSLQSVLHVDNVTYKKPEPRYRWESHSLPVTDLYVGFGGADCLVATTSMDGSCKIYDLSTGSILATLVVGEVLTAVIMDAADYHVFVGSESGNIYRWNLYVSEESKGPEDKFQAVYSGHKKKVSCLAVSPDGQQLLSGSHDNTANVWDVPSCQCLRTIQHKGPVTNALIIGPVWSIFHDDAMEPTTYVSPFKKHLVSDGDEAKGVVPVRLHNTKMREVQEKKHSDRCRFVEDALIESNNESEGQDLIGRVQSLEEINRQMFLYSVNALMKLEDEN